MDVYWLKKYLLYKTNLYIFFLCASIIIIIHGKNQFHKRLSCYLAPWLTLQIIFQFLFTALSSNSTQICSMGLRSGYWDGE